MAIWAAAVLIGVGLFYWFGFDSDIQRPKCQVPVGPKPAQSTAVEPPEAVQTLDDFTSRARKATRGLRIGPYVPPDRLNDPGDIEEPQHKILGSTDPVESPPTGR